ncbi:MAG TPA: hypothetical protein VE153_25795 [Myxococcus sp.]|jgi:outer membrane protein assembly factor BamB|nr:hypothetical protein [Myxococcus sp.]
MRFLLSHAVWVVLCTGFAACLPRAAVPERASPWLLRFGDGPHAQTAALVAEAQDLFATGDFQGGLVLGGQRLEPAGDSDTFLVHLGPGGDVRWLRRFGGAGGDSADALALGPGGSLFVVGRYTGPAAFGDTRLEGRGCFVAKVAREDGRVLWARGFGGQGHAQCRSVAVDAAGDALVAGLFQGTLAVGTEAWTSAGESDLFLAKLSGDDGAPRWARRFGGAGDDVARDVVVTPSGAVLLAGYFSAAVEGAAGAVDFGAGTLVSRGDADAFLARFDGEGRCQWARALGGPTFDMVKSVVVGGDGGLSLAGLFQRADVKREPGQVLFTAGGFEGFLARYSEDGQELWTHRYPAMRSGHALAGPVAGDVVLVGHFEGTLELDATWKLTSADAKSDAVAVVYDASGTVRRAERWGGAGPDYGYAVAATGTDLFVGGMLTGPRAFIARLPTGPSAPP